MGRIGKKVLGAVGGILGGEASKSALAKKAYSMGIGNEKLVKSSARRLGEHIGEKYIPFKSGGVVVVVNNKAAPKKRKGRKSKK